MQLKGRLSLGALALVAGIGVLWGMRQAGNPQEQPSTIQVSLAIFSSRPDPSWRLSLANAQTLRQQLATRPPFSGEQAVAGLGYGGFIIRDLNTAPADQPIVRVYRGQVQSQTDTQLTLTADPDRQLERWLLATADRAVLTADFYNIVTADLQRR